jgi:hypothetical protein
MLLDGVEVESFSSVIPITYVGALSSLLFGQDTGSFLDLCHQDKTQLVSEALNLEKWSLLSELAAKRTLDLKKELAAIDVSLVEVRGQLQALQTDKLEKESTRWNIKHQNDIRLATRLYNEAELDCKETQLVSDSVSKDLKNLVDFAEKELQAFTANKQKIMEVKQQLELHKQQKEQTTNLCNEHTEKLKFLQTTRRCPCCGMFLSSTYSEKHAINIKATISKYEDEVADQVKQEQVLVSQLNSLYELADDLHRNLVAADSAVRESSAHYKEVLAILSDIEQGQHNLKLELDYCLNEQNPYSKQLMDVKSRKREAQAVSLGLSKAKRDLSVVCAETEFWVQGFRNIRLNLIQDVLSHLSIVTTSKMESMGMVGWSVFYDIDVITKAGTVKKGFAVQVKSPVSPDFVPWEAWSGGERQRIRIAATLALSDVLLSAAGITFDFEIWDEPSTYITEEGFDSFLQLTRERAFDLKKRIFLTDHRQLDSGSFDGELRVTKRKKGSTASWVL